MEEKREPLIRSPLTKQDKRLLALVRAREKISQSGVQRESVRDPIQRAKNNPRSKVAAIHAKCCDCCGTSENPGWMTEIRKCPVTSCPLYQFRPYK